MKKMWDSLRTISMAQAVVLVALIISVAFTAHALPERLWNKLLDSSPETIAGFVTTVGLALMALAAQARRPGGPSLLLLAFALPLFSLGCGASAATRSAYALEQARCLANEREIVDRQWSTYDEDRADMLAERLRCDAALDAIEEAD